MKVLFIGNSFTARNNLPGLITALAAAAGKKFEHRLVNMGGASLRMHWNKGEAQAAIEGGGFDHVVLQEQSTLPVKNAARMRENVLLFDPVIRASGAKTALYMTWARQHTPEAQKLITSAYQSIGAEIDARVIPVGVAWENVLALPKHAALHDKDKSHPTLAGSYLAACVFYAFLFGESPVDNPALPKGISPENALVLQRAAADMTSQRTGKAKAPAVLSSGHLAKREVSKPKR